MTPAAASRGRSAATGHLSIGQVLARLSPEFPALTASKLRFLEVQGIVTPVRTDSGYRKFSPADVERLRNALTMQRDYGIPLARIREHLDEHGTGADAVDLVPTSIVAGSRRYRRDELLQASGASAALLNDAIAAGLFPASETYDERALTQLRTFVALEAHGLHPRHLRGVRQAAQRDVALIETALAPLLRRTDPSSRARAHEAAPELLRRIDELRAAYVHAALENLAP